MSDHMKVKAKPEPRHMPPWVSDAVAKVEAEPTIGKSLAKLWECIRTEEDKGGEVLVLGDILHNGNALTAAVVKNTAAHHEPIA